jgi:transposase
MITLEQPRVHTSPQPVHLPADLSVRLERRSLANLVVRIALTIDEGQLTPVASSETGGALQPRSLLALLVYCYAVGIFSSQIIEEQMDQDTAFRSLCNNEYPDWHCLRRFRRLNRPAIQRCLEELLGWASQWELLGWASPCRIEPDPGSVPRGCRQRSPPPAGAIEPDLRSQIEREASNRLNWAVQLDSMALDE